VQTEDEKYMEQVLGQCEQVKDKFEQNEPFQEIRLEKNIFQKTSMILNLEI
jgi:hypothetical protein